MGDWETIGGCIGICLTSEPKSLPPHSNSKGKLELKCENTSSVPCEVELKRLSINDTYVAEAKRGQADSIELPRREERFGGLFYKPGHGKDIIGAWEPRNSGVTSAVVDVEGKEKDLQTNLGSVKAEEEVRVS